MVQRRSARWVMNKYRQGPDITGPTSMINDLGWTLLITRRKISRLSLMYKMANNYVRMSYNSLLQLPTLSPSNLCTLMPLSLLTDRQ